MNNVADPNDTDHDLKTTPDGDAEEFTTPDSAASDGGGEHDFDDFRESQNYADGDLPETLTAIIVGKPPKKEYVRFTADPKYILRGAHTLDDGDDKHLVHRTLCAHEYLRDDLVRADLFLGITEEGRVFFGSVPTPGEDGTRYAAHESLYQAVRLAQAGWRRIRWSMTLKQYVALPACGQIPEPKWPTMPLTELLKIAFRGRMITTLDHPVVRKLQGKGRE